MENEFNLSDKIDGQRRIDGELVLSIEDVKEFIRLLKEETIKIIFDDDEKFNQAVQGEFIFLLDKFAGEKLI